MLSPIIYKIDNIFWLYRKSSITNNPPEIIDKVDILQTLIQRYDKKYHFIFDPVQKR